VRAGPRVALDSPARYHAHMNTSSSRSPLEQLRFDNRFVREMPADPEAANFRRQVVGAAFSRVMPTPVSSPQLVAYSREVAQLLDLPPTVIDSPRASEEFAGVFGGNRLLDGMDPHATVYGGHQFGNWAGQLGDGRAINLGEIVNSRGEHWALQLKGAGPTPYSRTADGLAVLRSSIREFLCSEAMHHLGVPTTRALSLVVTGEQVVRDMLYDGHPAPEPGAVVCRVAPSFIRFGHFEILTARGDVELLRRFADFTIRTEYPELLAASEAASAAQYVAWFAEVSRRTVDMIVDWMRVGFVHGVMNTDNMSILGLTIDYGPYGWLENYDPDWTPNTTDAANRRYRYGQQPAIAQWNLLQLANAIYPLIGDAEPLEAVLTDFARRYTHAWQSTLARKLGLVRYEESDEVLISEMTALLQLIETDMTLFFRQLADVDTNAADGARIAPLMPAYYVPDQMTAQVRARTERWLADYSARVRRDGVDAATRRANMNAVNPKYVLRNYLAQLAIDKAEAGDYSMVNELLDVLRAPYTEQPGREAFAEKRPDWARHRVGCSMLSCSS
jgi:uncharacterized protein YdiU (UPF0061 family)